LRKLGSTLGKLYSPGFGFLLMAITYIPIFLVIMFSFDEGIIATFPLEKISLTWYRQLFQNRSILIAFRNTLIIGAAAVLGSLIIGVSAAFLMHRYRFRAANLYQVVILLPFLLPGIFTGLALLLFFSFMNIPKSLFTVFIGHVVFCTAVVFKTVLARLLVVRKSLEEASYDLGATTFQTFIHVTLPSIRTALITGSLLAFVLSFDETLITFFVIGAQLTLPLKIWAMMRAKFTPQVHALASLVFLTSTVIVIVFSKYILGRESRR
jgi:ABC-type spermidine/putrescine transport system permease subunit II